MAVTKPVTGGINLATKVHSGVHADVFGSSTRLPRIRPPRPVYNDQLLRIYRDSDARGFHGLVLASQLARGGVPQWAVEAFLGAIRVVRQDIDPVSGQRGMLDGPKFLVFTLARMYVLADVQDCDDTSGQLPKVEADLATERVAALRLQADGSLTARDSRGLVLLAIKAASADDRGALTAGFAVSAASSDEGDSNTALGLLARLRPALTHLHISVED